MTTPREIEPSGGADPGVGKGESPVGSVARACSLLDALADARRPSTALELARATGQNRSTIHRTLRALQAAGLAERSGTHYQLAANVYRLGAAYLELHPFRRVALPYAVELSRRLVASRPWIVSLTIPVGREIVVIDRLCGPNAPLEAIQEIGSRFAFHHASTGMSALAFLDRDGAIAKVGERRFERLAPTLASIRAGDGVAHLEASGRPGLYGIARCVRDPSGAPIGAIAVSGFDLGDEILPTSLVRQSVARMAVQIEIAIAAGAM